MRRGARENPASLRRTASVFPGGDGAPYVIDGNNKGGSFGSDLNLPATALTTTSGRLPALVAQAGWAAAHLTRMGMDRRS